MSRFIKRPEMNAICVSLLSAFYAIVFISTANSAAFKAKLFYCYTADASSVMKKWSTMLLGGQHAVLAYILLALTMLVVIFLFVKKKPYDEYHTTILMNCLIVAIMLVFVAIAAFFLLVVIDPAGIVEKFMLFISLQWVVVILADLCYVLLSRGK